MSHTPGSPVVFSNGTPVVPLCCRTAASLCPAVGDQVPADCRMVSLMTNMLRADQVITELYNCLEAYSPSTRSHSV
jgi:hypothetical protein